MRRTLVSALALGVFVTLAFGSNQDMMADFDNEFGGDYDDAWEIEVPSGPDVETTIFELTQLSGRQIWMVNSPKGDCQKMEKLGMVVDCEQGRDTWGMEHEIVIWCEAFDGGIAQKILDHLGHGDFSIRTHANQPEFADNGECGELYEITIRYKDPGS